MLWKTIEMEFEQFLVFFIISLIGATEIIRTLKGKETVIMLFLGKILSLTRYLMKELKGKDFLQRMNALLAIMLFFSFLGTFMIFCIEYYKKSFFSETLSVIWISSLVAFPFAMWICEKFTRARYPL